ncbi:MAG: aminoacyl-tRNA hydrolase [Deltaproteobacteria bacterium]|nr:aminoacyl-tRNA hydrolase [Deltaproteobacteria bacterium]
MVEKERAVSRITPPTPLIPLSELTFTFSRSSGPGGQHVNKVNSRVTLWFDLWNSPSLTALQKNRLGKKLAGRLNQQGRLWLVSNRHRSQMANRQEAIARFYDLLREGLKTERPRKKTRISKAARKRRLTAKKRRGSLKRERHRPLDD